MHEAMCLPLNALSKEKIPLVGGKASNLGEMVRAGLPVPPGFAICAEAFALMMSSSGLSEGVGRVLQGIDREDCNQLREVEKTIRALIESAEVSDTLREEILQHYRALGTNARVAVRSSGIAEDLADASFAGQQETCLNIIGDEDLIRAVKHCWSSLFTARAIYYRCQKGFTDVQARMAVVVQKMVNSQKSGVTFTVDPVSRNPYQMLIEAVWGLGEGIVSGAITPDHYKIDRETYEVIFEFIAKKTTMYSMSGQSGVGLIGVPPHKAEWPVLTNEELRKLVDHGNRVEDLFGCPQDIEWAIEDDRLYLLQSRPITNL